MQLILKFKLSFLTTLLTVFAIALSGCTMEPKPTKSETIQAVLEETRLIGNFLSEGNQSEAMTSLEQANNLSSQFSEAKEDQKDMRAKGCNLRMGYDLRDIRRLYKYTLSVDQFANQRHAIGTIKGISISPYGDCPLAKEIYEEYKIAKSLLFLHLDSVFPDEAEKFEERYNRIVRIQRIRETEAFTAWHSMNDAEKKTFETSASVRACLDAATKDGALGITISDLQSACRQGLR